MTADIVSYPRFLQARVRKLITSKKASGLDEMICELAEACDKSWYFLSEVDDVWALKQLVEWAESL